MIAWATPLLPRRRFLQGLAAAPLAGLAPFSGAHAQAAYPTRPVRFVLPFGAGGVADVTSRLVMEKLGDKLGQRFVVENMPGAGGITAARAVQSATPDGSTLLLMTNGNAISAALFKTLPYDPLKDFVPVSSIGTFDCLFLVNAESPDRHPRRLRKSRERAARQAQHRHHHRRQHAASDRRAVQIDRRRQCGDRADAHLG